MNPQIKEKESTTQGLEDLFSNVSSRRRRPHYNALLADFGFAEEEHSLVVPHFGFGHRKHLSVVPTVRVRFAGEHGESYVAVSHAVNMSAFRVHLTTRLTG
jgi:hypothetical protein